MGPSFQAIWGKINLNIMQSSHNSRPWPHTHFFFTFMSCKNHCSYLHEKHGFMNLFVKKIKDNVNWNYVISPKQVGIIGSMSFLHASLIQGVLFY